MSDGYVKGCYRKALHEVRPAIRSYYLNHAFVLGHQWTFWDEAERRLDNVPSEADRIQATMNRTRANLRVLMSNLLQRELSFENPPTAFDDSSIRAARLGEKLLADLKTAHRWEVLREELMYAAIKGGSAAVSVDWDSNAKDTVEKVLTLGEFVVEPGARNAETARWWVRRQSLPQDEVWSMFRTHFPKDPPPATSLNNLDPYMDRVVDGRGTGASLVPRVDVFTYYERPNPLCPDGKILVEVDGKIVEKIEKWPFKFKDRLNIAVARETVVEGQWYGATFLDDVRPVQVALNAVWSNLLEHLRDAGNARLLVPSSAVDIVSAVTDIPGELLEYPDGTQPPSYLSPAQISAWIRDLPGMLGSVIDDIMGVHDVSRGMAPANIESGLGLSILAEKDSSPVGRLIKETVRVFSEVSEMVLWTIEDQVTEKRENVIMEGSSPYRFQWTGKDLSGQISPRIPLDAVQPRSRAAMMAVADKMMEMGLIQTIAEYARISDMPGQEDLISAIDPDVAKARRENGAFILGEVQLPASFDDHAKHIKEHNDFRKTQRYEQLDDEEREIVDLHIQAHETLAAEQAGVAEQEAALSPALAASPNADGSQVPLELLGQQQPPDIEEAPPPPENPAVDPDSMVNDILSQL